MIAAPLSSHVKVQSMFCLFVTIVMYEAFVKSRLMLESVLSRARLGGKRV